MSSGALTKKTKKSNGQNTYEKRYEKL